MVILRTNDPYSRNRLLLNSFPDIKLGERMLANELNKHYIIALKHAPENFINKSLITFKSDYKYYSTLLAKAKIKLKKIEAQPNFSDDYKIQMLLFIAFLEKEITCLAQIISTLK